ncbi:major facilitator superfamily domain-containing protein [Microdochium trichocladiopsis]|uniref:Probable transporter MCH1 n=1 Tax=Microdochium trichocladiopsis TaxID=1682393 RepID=A0A9P9BNW5_9PEZI|nr:major facilitator superfamily domain-containing protein [Microdochium trichocladiopsis]KAH7021283.1 major facilitator superfamily domain-containing protein [Microdochium trichocladiopsis]
MSHPAERSGADAPLLRPSSSSSTLSSFRSDTSSLNHAAARSARRRVHQARRALAFVASICCAISAGAITVFSLYGHLLQSRLHFSQFEVNAIATAMSIALYIPVPILGYACDRVGPGPLALFAAIFGGGGYATAAALFHHGVSEVAIGSRSGVSGMACAFVAIGMGTAGMYIAAITTCAKNFGKGRYRGLMLVAPIASFGLSAMLLSQIGSKLLRERHEDGTVGDVDVFKFFVFLATLFTVVGLFGFFALRVLDEEDLIDDAIEELERSGLLTGSEVFHRRAERSYGAIDEATAGSDAASLVKDDEDEAARLKKTFLLNAETKRFLTDPTMWWFAAGFWLINGPGEAFINNLGTVIGTLYSPDDHGARTTAATHVSIMAAVSTLARLLAASLSDLLSPTPQSQHVQVGASHASEPSTAGRTFTVSRVVLFIAAAVAQSIGTGFLAAGGAQGHGDRFWVVSGFVGAGYGAVFSITPIIITIIWGVENFGTNFGIIALTPAAGSTMWGLIYSAAYQAGASSNPPLTSADGTAEDDIFCHGTQCYAGPFWAMTVATWVGALMVLWAWKGRNGWAERGVVI